MNRNINTVFQTSDPMKDLDELAHILLNLRHHTRRWDEHFGSVNKDNKKRWEAAADRWIEKHKKPDEVTENKEI
jgi:hypothetical protein